MDVGSEMMTNHRVCQDITGSGGWKAAPITAATLPEAAAAIITVTPEEDKYRGARTHCGMPGGEVEGG